VRETGGDLPADVSFVGMAVDPAMRTLIGASCCLSADGSTSTWAWNGTVWRQLSAGVQPTFTVGLALDPAGGTLVLLGAPAFVADRQMWSWNGRVWTLVPGVHLPAFPAAAVTDSDDGHLVILGSLAEPVQGTPQPLHIWSWAGSIWTQRG
jgi:hypothetical protein